MPVRFTMVAFIFYFLVNIQGSLMALPGFNHLIHFTNFIVAHAHLALLGAFTILGMGLIDYAIPQFYKRPIYSRRLVEWQFWLVFIGFTGFFWSLTLRQLEVHSLPVNSTEYGLVRLRPSQQRTEAVMPSPFVLNIRPLPFSGRGVYLAFIYQLIKLC